MNKVFSFRIKKNNNCVVNVFYTDMHSIKENKEIEFENLEELKEMITALQDAEKFWKKKIEK